MWEFRRRPADQTPEQAEALEKLFQEGPELRMIHALRWQLTDIFDRAPDRDTTTTAIAAWREQALASGPAWCAFLGLYDRPQDGILAYFDHRASRRTLRSLNDT